MAKLEYVNRFSFRIDKLSQEATLTFFNEYSTVDENLKPTGAEIIEVSNIVMTEYNLRDLSKVLISCLNEIDTYKKEDE